MKIFMELEDLDKILEAVQGKEINKYEDTYYQELQRNDKNQVILHSWSFFDRVELPEDKVIAKYEIFDSELSKNTKKEIKQ